ncbi:MAG: hypothetical protein PHT43_07825, partial [Anaerolineaceae bacterium]|nr:hypothetical protein [Anaerolineaceae bacterium]
EDDIFIYDREKEQAIKIPKIDSEITEYSGDPSISGDGRYITYHAYRRADGGVWFSDIVVYDLDSGKFKIATRGFDGEIDSNSEYPVISADGRFVAFQSQVSDLVVDDTNGTRDVFVYMNELFGMEKNEIYLPMILK